MSRKKSKLENNKAVVDQYVAQQKLSYAETVEMEGGTEFLEYLIKAGIADDFAGAEYNKRRMFIPQIEVFPMIYMMNILSGEWSVRRTRTILTNEAQLKIMGFADEQLANGLTGRGKKNQYGEGYDRQPGIMAPTSVIDNLACFSFKGMEECFNSYIRRIAAEGDVDLGEIYILDSTIVETERGYPGAGMTRRKAEDGEPDEKIWGFKVFVLMSAKTKIPVAVHITSANEADSPMLLTMAEKGINNLGPGRIKVMLADRGFIDGSQMYRLKFSMGIDFVIPAKKNMDIWQCMVGLRNSSDAVVEEWQYGKKGLSGGYLTKGSVSYTQYAAEPAGNGKNQSGAPINGVVVTRWANQEIAPGKEKVMLTSLDTGSAIKIIKLYGQRSLIENSNFRELKQAAALQKLPQYKARTTEKTAKIHMLLCVFTLSVFTALVEMHYSNPEKANEKLSKNIREFRFMKSCEKGRVFVLVHHYYYIYDMMEFLEIAGFTIVPLEYPIE